VVGIARWPGRIAAGRVTDAIASTLDILPTLAALAGVALPSDRSKKRLPFSFSLYQ
jgi:arylsulfatase A